MKRIIPIALMALCFALVSVSSNTPKKRHCHKYRLSFDLYNRVLLDTELNKAVLNEIKAKFYTADTIEIAVAYYAANRPIVDESLLLVDNLRKALEVYLDKTVIKRMPRFRKHSWYDGVFEGKLKEEFNAEKTVLIKTPTH